MVKESSNARSLKKELHDSGHTADQYLEKGYDAICIHSNSTIIDGNQALSDLTGYDIDELTGLNAWILFPPASTKILMDKLKQQSEKPYSVLLRQRGGSLVEVELKGKNFDLNGVPLRAISARVTG